MGFQRGARKAEVIPAARAGIQDSGKQVQYGKGVYTSSLMQRMLVLYESVILQWRAVTLDPGSESGMTCLLLFLSRSRLFSFLKHLTHVR